MLEVLTVHEQCISYVIKKLTFVYFINIIFDQKLYLMPDYMYYKITKNICFCLKQKKVKKIVFMFLNML